MSDQKKLTRRDFLKATGAGGASLALGAAVPQKRFLEPFHLRQAVKVQYWLGAHAPEKQPIFRELFIDSFNKAHEGEIEIELTYIPWSDGYQAMQTALAAGEGPDMWDLPGPAWVMEYTRAGYTHPLDDYAEQFGWHDKLMPWAIDVAKVGDSVRCAPLTYQTQLTDYNKTLFDEKGWTVPTNGTEFEAWAEDALAQDVFPWITSSSGWQGVNHHVIGVYLQNRAGPHKFWEALQNTDTKFNDPVFLEATQLLIEHLNNGYFLGSRESYLDYGVDAGAQLRLLGEGGLEFQGTWMFQLWSDEWEEASQEWDWAPFPNFVDDLPYPIFNLGVSNTNCVNADSSNPEAAAKVLDWYYPTDEDGRKRATGLMELNALGDFLVPMSFSRDEFSSDFPAKYISFFEAINGALEKAQFGFTTWTFLPSQTFNFVTEMLDLVVADQMSPEEYLDGWQSNYEEELAQGLGIVAPEPIADDM